MSVYFAKRGELIKIGHSRVVRMLLERGLETSRKRAHRG